MKNILILVTVSSAGGAVKSTCLLAENLRERKYHVTLVTLNNDSPQDLDFNGEIIDLKSQYKSKQVMRLASLFKIISLLKKKSPDIVFCSDSPVLAGLVCFALKLTPLKNKTKCYHIQRNTYSGGFERFKKAARFFLVPILSWGFKKIYCSLDKVITISDGVANDLLQHKLLPASNLVTIYNPVVNHNVEVMQKESVSHAYFDIPGVKIIIGAGVLIRRKGFHVLIEAFAMLERSIPNMRLLILGQEPKYYDTEEPEKLRLMIKKFNLEDKVSLVGYVKNPFAYFVRADVFVLSSYEEGLSRVLIEAMACGATPVSTDCVAGPSEILENGKYGYLVPVGDAKLMAEGIKLALEKPMAFHLLKERASYFSVERSIDQYVALISER